MLQITLFTKQTHRHRKQTHGYQRRKGVGEVYIRSLGLADINYYMPGSSAGKESAFNAGDPDLIPA